MNNPKISIIAVYNSEQSVKNFIECLKKQNFYDFEVVLVNYCLEKDISLAISSLIEKDDRFHQITLPENTDVEFAKKMGLDIVSGDYICILDANDSLTNDYIQNLYYQNVGVNKNNVQLSIGRVYKRSFIENNRDIEEIIKNKIEQEAQRVYEQLKQSENNVQSALNDCYTNSDSNVNNKIYELTSRFNALEKLFYEKENAIWQETNNINQRLVDNLEQKNSHLYDYINGKMGDEISKVYQEITNNYTYTEKLRNDSKQDIKYEVEQINKRIDDLMKEQEIKYANLQKLLEVSLEDMRYQIEAINVSSSSENSENNLERLKNALHLEDNMNKNFEILYSYINKNNAKFYEELSTLYKQINDKIEKIN